MLGIRDGAREGVWYEGMSGQVFEEMAEAYEAMIDWPKRLANEEGFYRRVFEGVGAKSVVDVACGTGRHAKMLQEWGMRVEGADVSVEMIDRCRRRFGENERLRWVVRGFEEAVERIGEFDAAVCVGNSLALAKKREGVGRALGRMMEAVRAGGVVVVHVLNLWRLEEGEIVWQKCRRAELSGGESLIIKGVHRCGGQGYVEMVVGRLGEGVATMKSDCARFWGIEAEEMERMMRAAGAEKVEVYGGYQFQEYKREESQDLIVVAEKDRERR